MSACADHGLYATLGGEWNAWFPSEAPNLSYETQGIKDLYLDAGWNHGVALLPQPSWHWETNLGANHQNELLQAQGSSTSASQGVSAVKSLESSFERLLLVGSFLFEDAPHLDEFSRLKDRRQAIPDLEFSYRKEVFWIGVTPKESDLIYAAYGSGNNYLFPQGVQASQVTKFQELRLTFPSGGWELLFFLTNILLLQNPNQDNSYKEPLRLENMQTRLGLYFATSSVPFNTSEVVTGGATNGDDQFVYNAHFRTWGLVEEIKPLPDERDWVFNMTFKLGLASVKLRKDESLDIESSPLFIDLGAGIELGYRFHITDNLSIPVWGSAQASSFWGVTSDQETNNLQLNSFIAANSFLQMKGAVEWRF